jgi:transposase-like protein
MLSNSETAALLDDGPVVVYVACPMCQTPSTLTQAEIDAGAEWRCVRCGQHWDATRLTAVAAYVAWTIERAAGERVFPPRHVPTEQPDARR